MPVIVFVLATVGALVKFEIVLLETLVFAPEKLIDIPVMLAAPVLMLENVLLVMVFITPPPLGPFTSLQPPTVVAPVSVTFEKLFRFSRYEDPVGEVSP